MHPLTRKLREHTILYGKDLDEEITDYLTERIEQFVKGGFVKEYVYELLELTEPKEEKKTFIEKLFNLQKRLDKKFPTAAQFWIEFINTVDMIADEHFKTKKEKLTMSQYPCCFSATQKQEDCPIHKPQPEVNSSSLRCECGMEMVFIGTGWECPNCSHVLSKPKVKLEKLKLPDRFNEFQRDLFMTNMMNAINEIIDKITEMEKR